MYLVEVYLPRSCAEAASSAGGRARAAAEALARAGIRYVRTTFLPDDEACFHLFEAASVELVEKAAADAGLGPARVLAALDVSEAL
jgi:hypothetical protein